MTFFFFGILTSIALSANGQNRKKNGQEVQDRSAKGRQEDLFRQACCKGEGHCLFITCTLSACNYLVPFFSFRSEEEQDP